MALKGQQAQYQQALLNAQEHPSPWMIVWIALRNHKGALVGAGVFGFITFAVLVGPLFYPYDPAAIDLTVRNQGMSWVHWFGTDNLGRDTLARILSGGRVALSVGFTAMVLSLVLGTAIGLLAGYYKRLDGPLMRFTDFFLALPLLPLLLVIIVFFRDTLSSTFGQNMGIFLLVVVIIGITSWMQIARIVRSETLALKEREFVKAAVSVGTSGRHIVINHILPNILSPIMVSATLGIANAIITESTLSFLGLGFPSDFPTWGRLLFDGSNYIQINVERVIWPGLAISLTVLSINYMGDALRDAIDPRVRNK
ncbi:MAG: ABC transporter permease [Gammaproteobacteria bacterium]|nr:ABC transporter permease [Gammaproteobacteria bacterium]MYF52563.1 ABC transporter permease [Gammaproteobacteria bacterium]MYK42694.1 ABC transporter permease [Gammaproteobacteria bacterium]